jgi:hypothetical protein
MNAQPRSRTRNHCAELDAALNDSNNIQGPSAAVDAAISLTGQMLDLATAVISNH